MHLGAQVQAENGYKSLSAGRVYHFICRTGVRVVLVFFSGKEAVLDFIRFDEFETGLKLGEIRVNIEQQELPEWHKAIRGLSPEHIDQMDKKAGVKVSKRCRALKHLAHFRPLLNQEREVLSAIDPNAAAKKILSAHIDPRKVNLTREVNGFWIYLAYGKNLMALYPDYSKVGSWNRIVEGGAKLGRPAKGQGKHHGFRMGPKEVEKILKGFRRHARLGEKQINIWRKTLVHEFGCLTQKNTHGYYYFSHPLGEAFPSFEQFRYYVLKEIGSKAVHEKLYGKHRVRAKKKTSEGSFIEYSVNLMERVEADAFMSKAHPRGLFDDVPLPRLSIVRTIDQVSGLRLGVGFSQGAEKKSAYRNAAFCMAIPKVKFCSLWGIDIDANSWPSQGLPHRIGVDKGPGEPGFIEAVMEGLVVTVDSAVSYEGQSKAIVESTHPRSNDISGAPNYTLSKHSPYKMAVEEIYRILDENASADASSRLSPSMRRDGVLPFPSNIWAWHMEAMRIAAIQISFDEAVRSFLNPVEFTIKSDGLYLCGRRFDSTAFRETGLLERSRISPNVKVKGYVYELCLRHAWVEVYGHIVELDLQVPVQGEFLDNYFSFEELIQEQEIGNRERQLRIEHRQAVKSEVEAKMLEQHGLSFDDVTRKKGRAKPRSDKARAEMQAIRRASDNS